MKFRENEFNEVKVLYAHTEELLEKKIQDTVKDRIIIDLQFAVDSDTYYALILLK